MRNETKKFVAVVDRWSLFRGHLHNFFLKMGPQNCRRYRQVAVSSGLTFFSFRQYTVSQKFFLQITYTFLKIKLK